MNDYYKHIESNSIVLAVQYDNTDLSTIDRIIILLSKGTIQSYDEYKKLKNNCSFDFSVSPYRGNDYEGWYIITHKNVRGIILEENWWVVSDAQGNVSFMSFEEFSKQYKNISFEDYLNSISDEELDRIMEEIKNKFPDDISVEEYFTIIDELRHN